MLSWISLWAWNESPAKVFLGHNASPSLNQIDLIFGLIFVLGWTLMVFAMMLPTTIPLILSFHNTVASQYLVTDRTTLILVAITLALCGLYQFTNLKYRCLMKCRSPISFILARWHRNSSVRQALLLGYKHGIYCIGCCWTLMILMFLTGSTNLVLMIIIGGIMAVEKNSYWGLSIKNPLGYFLLLAAAVVVVWSLVI